MVDNVEADIIILVSLLILLIRDCPWRNQTDSLICVAHGNIYPTNLFVKI